MDDLRFVIGVDDRDLIRSQKEQKKFERNILTIESAFRKNQITFARYTSELNKQASALSKLGGTYKKSNSEVRRYASSVRKLTDDKLRMAQATNMAGKSTNRFGMYAQQVGYQVGDFFVQVQSGTSALVAFGQQGTQLAGLLPGVTGAVIGISLAVGTMLARSFMEASEAAKAGTEGLVSYKDAMKSATEKSKTLRLENYKLAKSFRTVEEAQLDLARKELIRKISEAPEGVQSYGGRGLQVQFLDMIRGAGKGLNLFGFQLIDSLGGQLDELDQKLIGMMGDIALSESFEMMDELTEFNKDQNEQQVSILNRLIDSNRERQRTIGLSGRELLVAQQLNEFYALKVELQEAGAEWGDWYFTNAVGVLELEQKSVLAAYDKAEADKLLTKQIKERAKLQDKINKTVAKANADAEKEQKKLADSIANSFGNAFMSIVDGTKSAKDAFKDMARDIIKQLYKVLVVEQMVASISGAIQGFMSPSSLGNVSGAPQLRPPSLDGGGYTGSGSRSGGLDGKGGFMAMLHPKETIIDHTKSKSSQGSSDSGSVVINQSFNFSANGDDSVKRIIAQAYKEYNTWH
jgi:hypothetical protein